jgi:phosphoglucomutase
MEETENMSIGDTTAAYASGRVKVGYAPVQWVGLHPAAEALRRSGFCEVLDVSEPVASFVRRTGVDLALNVDMDAGKVGVTVPDLAGGYVLLNGNQTGAMLLECLLLRNRCGNEPPNEMVVLKEASSSEIARKIAKAHGVKLMDTPTGFREAGKFLMEKDAGGKNRFIFAYGESGGYWLNDEGRGKDVVKACMHICEMTAFYKRQGLTLLQAMESLYKKYGYHCEDKKSMSFEGLEGKLTANRIMNYLRKHPVRKVGDYKVKTMRDYLYNIERDLIGFTEKPAGFRNFNELHFTLRDDSWFSIRTSGSGQRLKIGFGAEGRTRDEAEQKLGLLRGKVIELMEHIQMLVQLKVYKKSITG